MTEPTPRPWHQDEHGIIGPTGMVARSVAKCSKNLTPQPSYANARHIVKCVNAHDKLVAFVRWCSSPEYSSFDCQTKASRLLEEIKDD